MPRPSAKKLAFSSRAQGRARYLAAPRRGYVRPVIRRPRSIVSKPNGPYQITQCVDKGSFANTNIVESQVAYEFKLSDLDQVASLTALFDQYRVDKVELTFIPRSQVDSASGVAVAAGPSYMYTCLDYDDANIVSLSAIREYGSSKCHNVVDGGNIQIVLKPHIALAAFGGGVFTSYSNRQGVWIDVASTGVSHYGVKAVLPATGAATSSISFDVQAKYWITFRNVR